MAPRSRLFLHLPPGAPDLEIRGVSATLARTSQRGYRPLSRLGVREIERPGRNRWKLILPKGLRRANALTIFARLEDGGEVSHHFGIRPTRREGLRRCPMRPYSPVKSRPLRGLPPLRGRRVARAHGCTLRVVRRDGRWLPGSTDLRVGRLNVSVADGRIRGMVGAF